ncbi:MAG: xanthine dehydrogenase family protein molybdopterin-binding subunit [Ilumatobacteraceae bacterium]
MKGPDDLIRGTASFVADLPFDGLHAVFVRSDTAHGVIAKIDTSAALASPGVHSVETAMTIGLGPFQHVAQLDPAIARCPLAAGTVRYVGEAVAVVVADSHATAVDAAELVEVDIERSTPIPTPAPDSPAIYGSTTSNVVHILDDGPDVADPTADSAHVVEIDIVNPRLASAPMENDGIVAGPRSDGGLDVWCTSQGVHDIRTELATYLGIDAALVRVRSPAVGGGFGGRATAPVEFAVVAHLARTLGRPVRWIQTRSENLTGMPHGRGVRSHLRLGVAADGTLSGLDVDAIADAGATGHVGSLLTGSMRRQMVGLYRIPALRWRSRAVLTTTTPVGAYRGAGQPEANHARERAIDVAALRLGLDPIEFRRRNLLRVDELPTTQPGGVEYDAADPVGALDHAVQRADVAGWREIQRERRAVSDHREIGIGVACYAQTTGRMLPVDSAAVRIELDGRVTVACGSPGHGQSHDITWGAIVSERLGVDVADVTVVDADTDAIPTGVTTGGSAASQVVASVIATVCDDVVEAARSIAADLLEAAVADLIVVAAEPGRRAGLAVRGVPARRVTWAEISQEAAAESTTGCLAATRTESVAGAAHPYGAHITVVEVDTETGAVTLLAHTAVDDCGTVLQAAVVTGQQHGGSVAGLSQALFESATFDDDGLPEGSTLLTYLLPSAADLPSLDVHTMSTPTDRNPLGTRGIGENGCNGATASAHNAVIDALARFGIEHIDLPLTPERIWTALASTSVRQGALDG